MMGLGFLFVDTIPLNEQRGRANQVAELVTNGDIVDRINRDVAFQSDTVRGKYWCGVELIEIGTDPDEFSGFQSGVVLAHEVGHAFYDTWSPDSGIEEQAPTLPQYGRNGTGGGPFRATPRSDD